MKSLKDVDKEVLDQMEREVKLAESLDEKFKKLYLERALTCVKNQSKIYAQYLKLISQVYFLIDGLSDNLRRGLQLPTMFKTFLEKLEQQIVKITQVLEP